MTISPARFDLAAETQQVTVNLEQIDLARLLRQLDVADLSGEGSLDGSLPIQRGSAGLSIRNGVFFNNRPGVLRYAGSDAPKEMDNIALQALRDFRYNTLNATLNYSEDGKYAIKVRLEGHNPSVYQGYPIAFNINLSGQLNDLVRSVLFGNFETEIFKQIRGNKGG